ncbi:nudix (nucleoside diphosphate linked moiety X)-type motif 22, isoform CRA_a [Rattus norvegicus]|uniref:Nudix (Nucleoside diphosphate linked moiety X)-type motif 22, isoform CRA_a n=1 Tax=Rattus norvegicus TaxID=10116 RepID=A6HZM8_RAT|nr:nudix (nucleoside diphosphate linked moiety X)-type motif 22, isoform CRA_a [Rattus norvegicus]
MTLHYWEETGCSQPSGRPSHSVSCNLWKLGDMGGETEGKMIFLTQSMQFFLARLLIALFGTGGPGLGLAKALTLNLS